MALYYLSGDRKMKKKKKKSSSSSSSSKSEKKGKRKKKVAKIGLAPSRAAFLAVVNLNALKLATKLARIHKSPGGPEKLRVWWTKFGGDFEKLKAAISKGSKESLGCDMGVAIEVAIATALPITLALIPLIKQFKAGGDQSEMSEFDQGVDDGKKTLRDGDFERGTADMDEDKEVGKTPKDGGEGQATFFSPVGLIFKLYFLAAMFGLNGFEKISIVISSIAAVTSIGLLVHRAKLLRHG